MKKSIAVLASVLMLATLFSLAAYAATITPDTSSGQKLAQAIYGTPVIDGQIDGAWDTAQIQKIENVYAQDGLTESFASFRTMWDENYLYILAEVTDNTMGDADWEAKSAGGNLYKRDGVSFSFAPDYDRSETTSQVAPTFWCIIGAYGNTANWNTVPQEVFISDDGTNKNYGLSYVYDSKSVLSGYVIEVKFKLSARYAEIKMEAGTCIGFDIYTNDNNFTLLSATRNFGLSWSDEATTSYKNNAKKGTIQLLEKGQLPETVAEVTTSAPVTTPAPVTTKAPDTTKAPETTKAPTTNAPDTTIAPVTTAASITTDAEIEKGGCGSSLCVVSLAAICVPGLCIAFKRKKFEY